MEGSLKKLGMFVDLSPLKRVRKVEQAVTHPESRYSHHRPSDEQDWTFGTDLMKVRRNH